MLFRSPEASSNVEEGENNVDYNDDGLGDEDGDLHGNVRRSTRTRHHPKWYGDPVLTVMLMEHGGPSTYKEAMEGPESEKWLEAMKSEIGSMHENKVWTLVDIPNDRKAVENKWIFKKKTTADGNVTVYKARLVAKRF